MDKNLNSEKVDQAPLNNAARAYIYYVLYVFTVQSDGGVATTPHLSTIIYPTPGKVLLTLLCIKVTAKGARTAIEKHFV